MALREANCSSPASRCTRGFTACSGLMADGARSTRGPCVKQCSRVCALRTRMPTNKTDSKPCRADWLRRSWRCCAPRLSRTSFSTRWPTSGPVLVRALRWHGRCWTHSSIFCGATYQLLAPGQRAVAGVEPDGKLLDADAASPGWQASLRSRLQPVRRSERGTHGLRSSPGGERNPSNGGISIRCYADGGALAIDGDNDGPGLATAGAVTQGGLHNLRERLRLAFGDSSRLTIEERAEGGVRASLRMPLVAEGA